MTAQPEPASTTTRTARPTLDDAPFDRIHLLATVCVLGGAALDGYVLGVIGHAVGPASTQLGLSALGSGLLAASALIGVFVGGLFFGGVADRFGRRRVFLWNLLAFVVLSLAQLVVDSAWQLVAVRILLGLAIGVEYAVGAALLAEFVPRRPRGALLGSIQAMWIVGFVAAFLIGSAVEPDAWRWLLASSAVPAFVVLVARTGLPESPRWLHARGRTAEAERIVRDRIGDYAIPAVAPAETTRVGLAELFTAARWRQSLYAGLFWFCQVAPFFAIFTFVGPILALLDVQEGFTGDLLMNLLQLVGAGLGVWALHLLSRRAFVVSSFAVMVVGLLVIGLFPDAPGVLVVAAFGLFTLVISGASNIQFVYPSEMFETRLRTTGVGFAAAFSRIGAALATYLLPVSLDTLGAHGTLLLAAVFPLVGLVASLAWAPETRRSALA
ncbi:MFS transporter [Kineococcus sp. LSe6-4]|uniref:MFS transporter n=1 Tax=Kineococcus halophytocola TaxID=3234027 RepID=A0ABV4H5D8_9ACTN